MSRRHREDGPGDLPGQDSFLDIIANIVGILILLVVVVGIRAATYTPPAPTPQAAAPPQTLLTNEAIAQVNNQAEDAARSAIDAKFKAVRLNEDADDLDYEREKLATYVAGAEAELERQRRQLEAGNRDRFDLRVKLTAAETELDELARKQIALVSSPLESEVLKNVPTPLSRAVDGDEIALRLEGGWVATVPVERLIKELEARDREELRRLQARQGAMGRIGPVDGFEMVHTFVARRSVAPNGMALTMNFLVAEIRPTREQLGETVDEAIRPGSRLLAELARQNSHKTAVTIWTYPDSFEQVQPLRLALYEQGFATAVRPLAAGTHIGLSPFGSKSRVQ